MSRQQTLKNGEDESTFSREASPANLSVTPGSEKARMMTATSGRSCIEQSTKSNPLGLWLKMLVESSRWSSKARFLEWRTREIFSQRITVFDDTNNEAPSPSNESAVTFKSMDIPSSLSLFRLVPLKPPTVETESSSLRTETFLKTPCAADSFTDNMKSKGVSGTSGTLAQEVVSGYAEKHRGLILPTPQAQDYNTGISQEAKQAKLERYKEKGIVPSGTYMLRQMAIEGLLPMPEGTLLPTPLAVEREHPDRVAALKATGATRINSRANGEQRPNGLMDALNFYGMLPTPVTTDAKGAISEEAKRRRIEDGRIGSCLGQLRQMAADGLRQMAADGLLPTPQTQGLKVCDENGKTQFLDVGLLPTPRAKGEESYESRAARKGHNVAMTYLESAVEYLTRTNDSEPDMSDPTTKESRVSEGGTHSRLSPLFTEEMMGFPLMWTALPFLSQNGEQNP